MNGINEIRPKDVIAKLLLDDHITLDEAKKLEEGSVYIRIDRVEINEPHTQGGVICGGDGSHHNGLDDYQVRRLIKETMGSLVKDMVTELTQALDLKVRSEPKKSFFEKLFGVRE